MGKQLRTEYRGEEILVIYNAYFNEKYGEIEEVSVDCMDILGIDVEFKTLPDKLQSEILEIAYLKDLNDWELAE